MYFFFQAEDGIRDVERSRGLGDVYKRQVVLRDDGVELLPDPAAADEADDAGRAQVDLEAEQRVAQQVGRDLRQDGEAAGLRPAAAVSYTHLTLPTN